MTENPGFLRKKYSLHNAPEVKQAADRAEKLKGETVSGDADKRIQNYLDRFSELINREDPADKKRGLEALKTMLHKKFVIREENVPQSYFNLQGEIAVREGRQADLEDNGVEIRTSTGRNAAGEETATRDFIFPEDMKKQAVDIVQNNQKRSLDKWVDYLSSDDAQYPDWSKYWAMRSVLDMGKLKKEEDNKGVEKARFEKRTKNTVASFPPVNPRALALTIGAMRERLTEPGKTKKDRQPVENKSVRLNREEWQKLLDTENFSKLYSQFLIEMPEYSPERLAETRGEWKTYQQGSAPDKLVESLEGYPLEWCTADPDTARTQLQGGDFHVYYSIDDDGNPVIPRLAIRMEGDRIAEPPRGIAPDQNLDPYINPVLSDRLHEFGSEGEKYQAREQNMSRLTAVQIKHEASEQLEKEELSFLYEIDGKIEGFGYQTDPRIEAIKEERSIKQDYAIIYELDESQVADNLNGLNKETRVYAGKEILRVEENVSNEEIERLSNVIKLETDLTEVKQTVKDHITNWEGSIEDKEETVSYARLEKVRESLNAGNATQFKADSLQTVGGNLYAYSATQFKADSLRTVGKKLDARSAKKFKAGNLQTVGGNLHAESATQFRADSLQTVGGYLNAENAIEFKADSLQTVGGYLDAENAIEFKADSLQTVDGDLYAENAQVISAEKLNKVEKIIVSQEIEENKIQVPDEVRDRIEKV